MTIQNLTASADLDLDAQAAKASVSAPSLFGLSADAIVVGGALYYRSSLSGTKWTKTTPGSLLGSALPLGSDFPLPSALPLGSAGPSASIDIATEIQGLKTALTQLGATATLKGTEKVAGSDAYHVNIDIPLATVNMLISASGQNGVTLSKLTIDYWAYKGELRPAKLAVSVASDGIGNVDVSVVFSKYNQRPSIKAPPANQVTQS